MPCHKLYTFDPGTSVAVPLVRLRWINSRLQFNMATLLAWRSPTKNESKWTHAILVRSVLSSAQAFDLICFPCDSQATSTNFVATNYNQTRRTRPLWSRLTSHPQTILYRSSPPSLWTIQAMYCSFYWRKSGERGSTSFFFPVLLGLSGRTDRLAGYSRRQKAHPRIL